MKFKVGDRVRVVKPKTLDKRDHIGRLLIVSEIDEDWEYPYSTQGGYWLWCDDELEPAPITNFERIKAMSVEDFVNWVLVDSDVIARRYIDSFIGLREYLESEVQEDE